MASQINRKKAAYTQSHRNEEPEIVFTPDNHLAGEVDHSQSSNASRSSASSSHSSGSSGSKSQSSGSRGGALKTVRAVMTPRVVAVTSVTFLPEAAKIMKEEDVGALPVVQEDGKLLGIITDRDITVRAVAEGRAVDRTQVAEVYTAEDLVTITADTDVRDAEKMMADHQVRRLPIVGQDNKLIGMVSLGDLALETNGRQAGEVLKDVSKQGGEHTQKKE